MDGLFIKVLCVDQVEVTYPLRPRQIVAFEMKYGKGLAKLLTEDQKMEHIYYLAWEVLKANGHIVKPFSPEFFDTLEDAEFTSDPSSESTETH